MDELVAFFELRVSGGGTPQCSAKRRKQANQLIQIKPWAAKQFK